MNEYPIPGDMVTDAFDQMNILDQRLTTLISLITLITLITLMALLT